MPSFLRKAEILVTRRVHTSPPEGFVARSAFWLGLSALLLLLLRVLHIWRGDLANVLLFLSLAALVPLAMVLLWRWVFRYLLWRVRNRLIVTYLLMGLAPVVLFVTLAAIAAYVFSGQFATFAATSELSAQEQLLSSENHAFAIHVGHVIAANPKQRTLDLPESEVAIDPDTVGAPTANASAKVSATASAKASAKASRGRIPEGLEVSASLNGQPLTLTSSSHVMASHLQPANWVSNDFHGLVIDGGRLYFRAVDSHVADGQTVTLVSSLPLTNSMLDGMAQDLGRISIIPGFSRLGDDPDVETYTAPGVATPSTGKTAGATGSSKAKAGADEDHDSIRSVAGGTLHAPAHFYDRPVYFSAPLAAVDWQTGQREPSRLLLNVASRPTLLYQRLFGNSVRVGTIVRDVLISIAVVFGLLELFAFVLAVGLNRTITRSISDLYSATRAIDSGNFDHRIVIQRKDQLAALSTSFNSMSASLAHLLAQQREKERLQSELNIAHEVQNSLLPQGQIRLPMLEVHGATKAARGVSGDYYDFLLTGHSQLALALGDISGKGISAALLMASLHSAVRAYRFGESGPGPQLLDGEANLLAHPALMLERLNRHLYTSTQAEKYATLFLAHYDGATHALTYSNGGQLPPLLLRTNGEVNRLDCGGSVVGLLDGMKYEQAMVSLGSGDIVIIYSDGVTEPENEFGDFGEDRLLDLVRRNRTQTLESISNSIMQAIEAWIGQQEQPDDITLVLARQL